MDLQAQKLTLSTLCVLFASLIAQPGDAYQRSMTCRIAGSGDPAARSSAPICGPRQSPWPMFWAQAQLTVHWSAPSLSLVDLAPEEVYQLSSSSLEAWSSPECSRFEFITGQPVMTLGHDPDDGLNVIAFVDQGWAATQAAFAITSVSFRDEGELYDADLEFNAASYQWSLDASLEPERVDLGNTLTHEAGHMLGLDHSAVPESTMYFDASPGQTSKRSLEEDDINGLCESYPVLPPSSPPALEDGGCCAQRPGRAAQSPGSLMLCLLCGGAGWGVLRRRSKKDKRP